jgi:hypothetical protein
MKDFSFRGIPFQKTAGAKSKATVQKITLPTMPRHPAKVLPFPISPDDFLP